MSPHDERINRVAPATAIISSILFSPLLLVGLQCIFQTGQFWTGLSLCTVYPATILAFCSPTVFINNNTLTYRSLFFVSRSIDLSTVIKLSVTAQPAPTLQIFSANVHEPFSFIVKPFSKAGITYVMKRIRVSAPNADFDAISDKLLTGDFSSLTREAIKTRNLIRIVITVGGTSIAIALVHALTN